MRASLNISLPEEMKEWVESQVAAGGYGTASEYFRQLIRDDRQRRVREAIDAKLLSALDSGEPIEMTPEWWAQRRKVLERQAGQRKSKQ